MNNAELDAILKKARVPGRLEEFWESLPGRIALRLGHSNGRAAAERPKAGLVARWGWAAAATVGVLAALLALHWSGPSDAPDVLASPKLIDETLAMFPNRVRAIVRDEHGLRLVLSERGDVPASAPLYVKVCDGAHCASAVTFSGQEVRLAGQSYTVLADVRGGIILMGSQVLWSSGESLPGNGKVRIEARKLGSAHT